MRNIMAIVSITALLTGCADHADKIQATYVSPTQFQELSCHQIRAEVTRVSHKVNEISGVQDSTATSDAWATGVGLVLFWPSLFFIAHGDQHAQLAELKGEYDALEQAAIVRILCRFEPDPSPSPLANLDCQKIGPETSLSNNYNRFGRYLISIF